MVGSSNRYGAPRCRRARPEQTAASAQRVPKVAIALSTNDEDATVSKPIEAVEKYASKVGTIGGGMTPQGSTIPSQRDGLPRLWDRL